MDRGYLNGHLGMVLGILALFSETCKVDGFLLWHQLWLKLARLEDILAEQVQREATNKFMLHRCVIVFA